MHLQSSAVIHLPLLRVGKARLLSLPFPQNYGVQIGRAATVLQHFYTRSGGGPELSLEFTLWAKQEDATFVINPKSWRWEFRTRSIHKCCVAVGPASRALQSVLLIQKHRSFSNIIGPQFYFYPLSIHRRAPEDPTNDVCPKQVHRRPRGLPRQLHPSRTKHHEQPVIKSSGGRFSYRPSQASDCASEIRGLPLSWPRRLPTFVLSPTPS